MADRSAKLRLGGFVAAALATLAGLVILFGGSPKWFTSRASYTITFAEAPNVGQGTPVRRSGVRVGEVTGIDLDPQSGLVNVSVQIEKRFLPRTSDEPTIFRGLLSGDTSVDFLPKTGPDGQPVPPSAETVPPGSIIPGVTPVNPSTLVRQASGVLPSAQESMARILNSVQRFELAVPRIEKAFDEIGGLARSGREFVPELRRTNDELQKVLASNGDQDAPGIRTTMAELRDFLRTTKPLVEDVRRLVRTNEADITGAIKGIRQTSESLNDVLNPENRKTFAATLKNLESATDDLTKTIRLVAIVLDQGDKTLKTLDARLVQSEATIRNLELASKPLAENAEPIAKNVAIAADQLARTLVEVRELLRLLNRDGTIQRALTDPTLFNNLNEAAASLARTLMRAEKVAQDLHVFSDKIARHPELIGLGGAVHPSAGLKESPTAPLGPTPIPPVQPKR
jgi:phospholipid/cholesterol/gamma-HCH transport system substrate-binding protein